MAEMLSPHLTLAEVVASDTAKRLGIDNTPPPGHIVNLKLLASVIFEPLRAHFGVPIHVSSGYRSKALNDAMPGAATGSQHMKGEALDLDQDGKGTGVTNRMVFEWIRANLPFDQLIWEMGDDASPDWVHVSYSAAKRRGDVLKAHRVNGKTVYAVY